MRKIFKYQLSLNNQQGLMLPKDAEVLSIQMQGAFLSLWAIVDPEEIDLEARVFRIFATGEPIRDETLPMLEHISTIQSGGFVWHAFEETK